MKASTHRLVTPGWAYGRVGNEPSDCCCEARNASPRSTERSTRRHSSDDKTLAGVSSERAILAVAGLRAPDRGTDFSCASSCPTVTNNSKVHREEIIFFDI